jgi:hypothetical protein
MRLGYWLEDAHLAYIVATVRSALHHVDALPQMADA